MDRDTFKIKSIAIKKQELTYPDIDTDVAGESRNDIVDYLIDKYGQDHVAMVGNKLEYAPKSVIRDLGQVYEIPFMETTQCTKDYNDVLTAEENCVNAEINKYFNKYPKLKKKVDKIVGCVSSLGIHAGGVVITDKKYPLRKYCALQRPNDEGRVATLWTKNELQPIGIIKYDLLGLTTAGQNHLIKKMVGMDPYKSCSDVDDPEVYRDIVMGQKHKNIFQFDGALGLRAFQELMPQSFMELSNASGIIRVLGSQEGRDIYTHYMQIVEKVHEGDYEYWRNEIYNEVVEPRNQKVCLDVLKDSYGILIYQEQLANLVKGLSGGKKTFTDGNKVRKSFETLSKTYGTIESLQGSREGLKKWHDAFMNVMKEYVLPFIGRDGWDATEEDNPELYNFLRFNLDDEDKLPVPLNGIIKWFISSTAYLFSKLHAVAYTMNSYDGMWLKHHYPLEFWTGSLIHESGSQDKIGAFINAITIEERSKPNDEKITILPPCVNKSKLNFSIEGKDIRFGLTAIMNVNETGRDIINARGDVPFKDMEDFCSRVGKKALNKRTMEALLYTNAFACFGSIPEIYEILKSNGVRMGDLKESELEIREWELRCLGYNISFPDEFIMAAQLDPMLKCHSEVTHEFAEPVPFILLEKKSLLTKKNKPYFRVKLRCIKCGQEFNSSDFKLVTAEKNIGAQLVIRISRSEDGQWYNIEGVRANYVPTPTKKISSISKKEAKKVLEGLI